MHNGKFGCALWGCGWVAGGHIAAYLKNPDCEFIGLGSRRCESAQAKLAEFMYGLGCVQAFNLDGGNSAEMVFGQKTIKGMPDGDERTLSDIIYFASIQP